MKTFIEFENGQKMPIVGYGTWQCDDPKQLEDALDVALEAGYRHFDTAYGYRNETVLGKTMKRWFETGKVKREELFIVTKLPAIGNHPDRVQRFLQVSLDNLQLDYVDLYLNHNPCAVQVGPDGLTPLKDESGNMIVDVSSTLEETWKALEKMVEAGKAKSIGISNYSIEQIERIIKCATIKPVNLQIEVNACYPQKALREVCKKHGISVCAFAPLGSPGRKTAPGYIKGSEYSNLNIPSLLEDPIVNEIAKKVGKTPAQILLRYLAQQDVIVIPKSVTPARIKSNFDLFSFELDENDMKKLDSLDSGNEGGTWALDWRNGCPGIEKHPEFCLKG